MRTRSRAASSRSFYSFPDPFPTANITFHVSTTMGAAEVFVTNTYAPASGAAAEQGQLPTAQVSLWNSWWSRVRGSVTVSPGHSAGWTNCGLPYTVGVECVTECTFTIVATSTALPEMLQLGVPSTVRTVAKGANSYFSFELPGDLEDIRVVATPISGNPVLLLGTNSSHPVRGVWGWARGHLCGVWYSA